MASSVDVMGAEFPLFVDGCRRLPAMVVVFDMEGRIVEISDRFAQQLGKAHDDFIGKEFAHLLPQASCRIFNKHVLECAKSHGSGNDIDLDIHAGEDTLLDASLSWTCFDRGSIKRIVAIIVDAGVYHSLSQEKAAINERCQNIIDSQSQLVCRFDTDYKLTFVNRAYCDYFGRIDLVGTSMLDLVPSEMHPIIFEKVAALKPAQAVVSIDEIRHADGSVEWREWTDLALTNDAGDIVEYQAVGLNITERKVMENLVHAMAYEDALTGLANRKAFDDALETRIVASLKDGKQFALISIDLDYFKAVNDTLGHKVGDDLLIEIANRLNRCLKPGEMAFRLGGDEFAILTALSVVDFDLSRSMQDLLRLAGLAFQAGPETIYPSLSIGSAQFPKNAQTNEELRGCADAALYASKASGRGSWRAFQTGMADGGTQSAELIEQVRSSLKEGRFDLVYQPLIDLSTGTTIGVEALLRWDHPQRGGLQANQFIKRLEDSPAIIELTSWVALRACEDFQLMRRRRPKLGLWMNVAERCLSWRGFVDCLADIISSQDLAPRAVTLEISATSLLENAVVYDTLLSLRMLGVRIALSGFIDGQCSLIRLAQLPVDVVKINCLPLDDIEYAQALAIIRGTLDICAQLGIELVVEGIGDLQSLNMAKSLNVKYGQGFFLSHPIPINQFMPIVDGVPEGVI